ncbi:MAG: hypothetical protein WHS64_03080 [Fervidobacterium sp.]|uniref:GHMP family kinase ATP-binding protein n=1 Tax=Fervidobacterium TaxID=2422 RepID=UPI0030A62DCF
MSLKNNIPLAHGLGSNSAAIFGGLIAANVYLGFPLSADGLLKMTVELEGHPDNVAPAFFGGVVICSQSDFRYAKLPTFDHDVVLAIPDFEVKTS